MPTPRVVLTFDDGPDPVWTPRIIDALGHAGWRASFFVNVARACCYPETIVHALDAGHAVELHCVGHVAHDHMTPEEGAFDARLGLELLRTRFGNDLVSRWRPPYGSRASWQRDVAERLGLRLTWWSVDTRDWTGISAQEMLADVRPRLRDGTVLLMHDAVGPGATRAGVEQTVRLLELLASDGVACKTF